MKLSRIFRKASQWMRMFEVASTGSPKVIGRYIKNRAIGRILFRLTNRLFK